MRDSGLAATFGRYADPLYIYCRFLLREPADALDAVEDTFLVAVERLPGPPEDDWLRPWLFAVARNACLSRLRSGRAVAAPDPAHDEAAAAVTAAGGAAAGGGTDRALARAALGGLTPGERDVIGMLWHGLDVAEISSVLGIGRDAALSLFSRARDRLELCAVALVVASAAQRSCPELDAMLGSWGGQLTEPLARKLSRHIDRCAACGTRRREELRPSLLLSLTPGALLGAAITDDALRQAAARTRMLRRQALSAAADPSPEGAAMRAMACRRQGSFGESGFPKPLGTGSGGSLRGPRGRVAAAAVAAAVAAAAGVAFLSGGSQPGRPAGAGLAGLTQQAGGGTVSAVSGTRPPGSGPAGRSPGPSASARSSPSPSASASASPSASATSPAPKSSQPSPSASRPPDSGSSPSAKATSARPSPTASATFSAPSSVTLQQVQGQWPPQWQGTLTVTVSGGSLPWSVAADKGLAFSPAAGSASAAIAVTGQGRGNFAPITITAGGATYTVNVTTRGGW